MATYKGIDVSHWQGTINWTKVKAAGYSFVIIKAGGSDSGHYRDSAFERNYAGATAAGLHVGAYYFAGKNCTDTASGEADAKHFLQIIKGKKFDYPVILDYEAATSATKKGNTDATIAFCNYLIKNKYCTAIYASDISGFKDKLDCSRLGSYDKWVARYGSKPKYITKYTMWQYSSTGKVSGISGNVDMDECYKDYPTYIKKNGLNGYPKSGGGSTPTTAKKYSGNLPTKFPPRGYYKKGDGYLFYISYREQIKYIQSFLNWAIGTKLVVDGKYGAKTFAAVKTFQKKTGVVVDGLFGKATLTQAKAYKK